MDTKRIVFKPTAPAGNYNSTCQPPHPPPFICCPILQLLLSFSVYLMKHLPSCGFKLSLINHSAISSVANAPKLAWVIDLPLFCQVHPLTSPSLDPSRTSGTLTLSSSHFCLGIMLYVLFTCMSSIALQFINMCAHKCNYIV